MQKVSRFLHHSSNNRELKSKNMQEIWKDVKVKYLGAFNDEYQAHLAYKKALNSIINIKIN